eukprot:CAMPEP_0178373114 /NCGR_PEP_ID=MMETSP0689_2-20121128/1698_1 /TAXON_ID=160604 /ORGANISM="Amphidinium massartii, Strain CS-259" /LENGTH=746 /DNA_ID=CAMNT_0019993051 /DNA_START=16 /DNA_END=2256 /DNA_ORIENTATION=-
MTAAAATADGRGSCEAQSGVHNASDAKLRRGRSPGSSGKKRYAGLSVVVEEGLHASGTGWRMPKIGGEVGSPEVPWAVSVMSPKFTPSRKERKSSKGFEWLGPPLTVLQGREDVDPAELQAYRANYQAFRVGQAAGARGEIGQVTRSVTQPGAPSPRVSEDDEEDAAYYSEPERDIPLSESLNLSGLDINRWDASDAFPSPQTDAAAAVKLDSPKDMAMGGGPPARPAQAMASLEVREEFKAGVDRPLGAHTGGAPSRKWPMPSACSATNGVGAAAVEEASERPHTNFTAGTNTSCSSSTAATPVAKEVAMALRQIPSKADLNFTTWLSMELSSRPEQAQLGRVPRSHLLEVAMVPWRVEKVLGFGMLQCMDIILHELSFTPLQAVGALPRFLRSRPLSVTEQCDLLRLSLLLLNVWLVSTWFDVSAVYHYIRGESFLKLYVIFNMLEMFERWCRSVGVDLFDLVMSSVHRPWRSLLPKYIGALIYCFVHSMMHFLRILLLNVAINTSQSAVFLIIFTNNFGEIKSTVFKKYQAESLFPIIASDVVERFYLFLDILFVLLRLCTSSHRAHSVANITFWLVLLVAIELLTDWVKLCLIAKFSELPASTFEDYKEVLIADILLCRTPFGVVKVPSAPSKKGSAPPKPAPAVPFRGIHSFSHVPARRLGFSGVPISTLVVIHGIMILRSPCAAGMQYPTFATTVACACAFVIGTLAKMLLSTVLLGFAARRRKRGATRGLELFSKIKAL